VKKILVMDGHPHSESFVSALCGEYVEGAKASGFEVQRLNIRGLDFDPNLAHGYRKIQELESDLVKAQQLVLWCDHLVFAYPIWWGSMPAITKGFFDRSWLPGFAFKYHQSGPFWDKLLAGRSARIISTSDAPVFFNYLAYFGAPYVLVKKMIFRFCGIKPVRSTNLGGIKNMSAEKRATTLDIVKNLGARGA
jgi:NAD(P)H dehydrogenase (quinone)